MTTDTTLICGFDVTLPLGRAKLLAVLKNKAELFSTAERSAYDALRDELVRVARGEGSLRKVEEHVQVLAHFVSEKKDDAPVARSVEEKKEEPVVAEKQEENVEVPVPQAVEKAPITLYAPAPPAPQGYMRHVRGPDISKREVSAPVSVPPSVSAPVDLPVTPVVSEPVSVSQQEVATESKVEDVSVSLRDEVETINESLIELGHGRAFQWLNDPKTGYREYMTELLSIRDALMTPAAAKDQGVLRARISALKEMAAAVRVQVGGDVVSAAPTSAASPWGAAETPTVENVVTEKPLTPTESIIETSVPQPAVTAPEIAVVPEPEAVLPPPPAAVPPVVPPIPPSPSKVSPWGVQELGEVPAKPAEEAPLPPVVEQPPVVGESDPLHAREIDAGLTDLLTRWLGTTGFLGFGDSGLKHPEWLIMKTLMVEDVLVDDGTLPNGLRAETYRNLRENIKAWRSAYSLAIDDRELVEHFIRRVVQAGMTQNA